MFLIRRLLPYLHCHLSRYSSSISSNNVASVVHNRNPRNLERLRIAQKPSGYTLDNPGREYWYKLEVIPSTKYITARIIHHTGYVCVQASSKEWAINKFLYRGYDMTSYVTVGKVLAQRCLESGYCEVYTDLVNSSSPKVIALVKELEKGGVSLTEASRYIHPLPSDHERPEKPWEVNE